MRRALISDIHANLEALGVVLDDIKAQNVDEIFCLGDVIGYGPNPCECIDLLMEACTLCLLGNHDQGALFDPDGFNIGAEKAIFWTREQLENPRDRVNNERRWEFLSMLPRTHRLDSYLFVHGSPRNPLSEYIFPEDIYNHRKMERLFQLVEKYCFQGHTHVPGVFTEGFQFYSPEEVGNEYTLGEGKIMINVGSVGQPRDGDPRACYVLLEDGLPAAGADPVPPTTTTAPGSCFVACRTTSSPPSGKSTRSRPSNPSWGTGCGRAADRGSSPISDSGFHISDSELSLITAMGKLESEIRNVKSGMWHSESRI